MQRTKKLSIECVNRVKLEMVEEFQDSIFSDVYSNAHMQIERMIAMADAQESDHEAEEFCNGKEISNVISFVGERGMGKSSAMLSFAYFLKKYPYNIENKMNKEKSEPFRFRKNGNKISFYTLPKVDATILTNESLVDVVLAKMWTEFNEKAEQLGEDKFGLSSTKERFNSIKNAYTLYYKDDKQNKNLTSVKQLQELSRSMALREEFAGLVSSFLECMAADSRISRRDCYLVIPIDDLDLASGKTLAILEQLRIFLSVPQVIVLTTVDIERLLLNGNKKFFDELIYRDIVEEDEKNLIRQYSNQYIAKVLPRNSRISMPRYGRNADVKYVLDYNRYVSGFVGKSEEMDEEEGIDYFSFVNMVIAKYLNLIMKHGNDLALPGESLRNIVNRANELWMIHCYYSDNAKNFVYEWLEKEISLSLRQFYGLKNYAMIKNFSATPIDDYNMYMVYNFTEKKKVNTARAARAGYGQVLCCLLDMRNEDYGERDLLKELVLLYSLRIAKCMDEKNPRTLGATFVRGDIFSSVVSRKVRFKFEEERIIDHLLRLELEYDAEMDSVGDIMRKNAQQIVDLFKVFLFCDMEEVMRCVELEIEDDSDRPKEIPVVETDGMRQLGLEIEDDSNRPKEIPVVETDGMRKLRIGAQEVRSWVSVDNFFGNAIWYEELFRDYIYWIYKSMKKHMSQKMLKDDKTEFETLYDDILDASENGVKDMQQWKQEYRIGQPYDVLPIQNVGVMLDVMDRIKKSDTLWESIDQMMNELAKAFLQEFDEAERECLYEELGYQRYSTKFLMLLTNINLRDVPSNVKDRLAVMGHRYEDTMRFE